MHCHGFVVVPVADVVVGAVCFCIGSALSCLDVVNMETLMLQWGNIVFS